MSSLSSGGGEEVAWPVAPNGAVQALANCERGEAPANHGWTQNTQVATAKPPNHNPHYLAGLPELWTCIEFAPVATPIAGPASVPGNVLVIPLAGDGVISRLSDRTVKNPRSS